MFQLGKILVLSIVAGFGTASIAANAVSGNIATFAILPGMSIGYAMLTVAAQCVGAGDYKQVEYYTKKLLKIIYLSLIAVNIVVMILLPFVIKIYDLSAKASGYAYKIVVYHTICAILIWPLSFSLPEHFKSSGGCKICDDLVHHFNVDFPYRIQRIAWRLF